jgi:hypothetical protein
MHRALYQGVGTPHLRGACRYCRNLSLTTIDLVGAIVLGGKRRERVNRMAPPADTSPDLARIKYGAWLILAAFVLLGIVFALAVVWFRTAADVSAVIGAVAGVVGTIVGAFFGVQVGSAGREAAEAGRARAEDAARIAMLNLPPDRADDVMRALR